MASSAFSEGGSAPSGQSESVPANIALHVLSPSLPPPSRFTLNDLPRSTTVADLKTRISQSIPGQPSSVSQRLIYRGKPLMNQNETLQTILEPPDVSNSSDVCLSNHCVLIFFEINFRIWNTQYIWFFPPLLHLLLLPSRTRRRPRLPQPKKQSGELPSILCALPS